jgi:hypothetical protein
MWKHRREVGLASARVAPVRNPRTLYGKRGATPRTPPQDMNNGSQVHSLNRRRRAPPHCHGLREPIRGDAQPAAPPRNREGCPGRGFHRGGPKHHAACGRLRMGPPTQPPMLPLLPSCTPHRITKAVAGSGRLRRPPSQPASRTRRWRKPGSLVTKRGGFRRRCWGSVQQLPNVSRNRGSRGV